MEHARFPLLLATAWLFLPFGHPPSPALAEEPTTGLRRRDLGGGTADSALPAVSQENPPAPGQGATPLPAGLSGGGDPGSLTPEQREQVFKELEKTRVIIKGQREALDQLDRQLDADGGAGSAR